MLKINESSRVNPSKVICECGTELCLTLHHDFAEVNCHNCKKMYVIKVNESIWNCCAKPENPQSN
jgi:hypothetical protein